MNKAPVVVFAYNRPQHLMKTIESLKDNFLAPYTDLIVYSDGPKNELAIPLVMSVRKYLQTLNGFKSITIEERESNYGLSNSIIDGVTSVINKYGKIIVVEDDLITSPYFLTFINDGLDLYENEEDVISVQGYIYPLKGRLNDYFFIRGADCQGWATWKRGWDLFEKDGKILLNALKEKGLFSDFNFSNTYPYVQMLKNQIAGITNSWAIRWYASAFIAGKYTLYPRKTMILNIGFDQAGTNTQSESLKELYKDDLNLYYSGISKIQIQEDYYARDAFKKFFKTLKSPFYIRLLYKAKFCIKKIMKN